MRVYERRIISRPRFFRKAVALDAETLVDDEDDIVPGRRWPQP